MSSSEKVNILLQSTLETLGCPVERLRYTGKSNTFITYQILHGLETAHADDDNESYQHFFRADLFSKKNHIALLGQMKMALKAAGFYGISVNAEMYENDTGFYHVSLDFYFMEV